MNVLFVTEDHSTNNYGVTTMVSQLADHLVQGNNDIHIIVAASGSGAVAQREEVLVKYLPISPSANPWRWSPHLVETLAAMVDEYAIDLLHLHGVWMAAQWAALVVARQKDIPCVLTSHGMLQPWFLNSCGLARKYKKAVYLRAVLRPALSKRTVLHAITPLEKEQLEQLFPAHRVVVVPSAFQGRQVVEPSNRMTHPEKYFLFLGRLHPIKGVDLLIEAFSQSKISEEWCLIIVGPEEVPGFADRLKTIVSARGLTQRIRFMAPVFGEKKWDLVKRAWAVVVPSYSEVMSMVNLEAAACGVPSITTYETGLWDWESGGGRLIHPSVHELSAALQSAAGWQLEERMERGQKSRQLLASRYSWDVVIPQWERLYAEMLNR